MKQPKSPRTNYRIAEFAEYMGVTPDFLKHYEECGLLDVHHRENGYRYFNFDQCSRILEYMRLRNYNRIKTLQREISRLASQTKNAKHFLTVPGVGDSIMAYMCVCSLLIQRNFLRPGSLRLILAWCQCIRAVAARLSPQRFPADVIKL